jgi:hypothetical protein
MDNIEALQAYVEKYLENELKSFYDIKFWMKSLTLEVTGKRNEVNELWNKFGPNLTPKLINVVLASEEPWTPCVNAYYTFHVTKDISIQISALLQKDKVAYVRTTGTDELPNDFDYVKAFEQRVPLMNALSGSAHTK